mmetsp:Transcript_20677/g.57685  ORF Transcript_20677/g.57685 Transcript_20677/m.57685 type:complete len:215 (-) Transcript_20677:435-1079(-)
MASSFSACWAAAAGAATPQPQPPPEASFPAACGGRAMFANIGLFAIICDIIGFMAMFCIICWAIIGFCAICCCICIIICAIMGFCCASCRNMGFGTITMPGGTPGGCPPAASLPGSPAAPPCPAIIAAIIGLDIIPGIMPCIIAGIIMPPAGVMAPVGLDCPGMVAAPSGKPGCWALPPMAGPNMGFGTATMLIVPGDPAALSWPATPGVMPPV